MIGNNVVVDEVVLSFLATTSLFPEIKTASTASEMTIDRIGRIIIVYHLVLAPKTSKSKRSSYLRRRRKSKSKENVSLHPDWLQTAITSLEFSVQRPANPPVFG
jgi:hypothetical protein